MSKSGVYQILNKVNGKYYVGSAIDIEERWLDHRYRFKTNKNSRYLQNAWNKHGEEAFQFNVLEYVQNPEWLIEIEQYWIDFLEASNPKFGYNICPIAGSSLGVKRSEETKIRISEANRNRKHTEESKRKISEGVKGHKHNLGKMHSEETKKKISNRNKGKPSPMLGKKHSEETRRKMSERAKGENNSFYGCKHTEETKNKLREINSQSYLF